MEMKHRIVSITTAFVMALSLCSAFCLTAQSVSAASKTKSVYIMNTAVEQESTGRYEKIGKYYFWTERYGSTYLKCATSISGKAKKLDTAKNNMEISPCIVTDGQQIYYTINKYDKDDYSTRKPISSTFYKTTVKGKKKKIKTVSSAVDLYAYYNGKLYYGYGNPEPATNLNNPRTGADGTVTWDCVWFGHYPQSSDGNGGFRNDPIKWRVLSVEGNEALLLADKCLDAGVYNEKFESITWETSTIRSWLNGNGSDNFMGKAFSTIEQGAINEKTIQNPDNPKYGTAGGNTTRDKVFFLSIDEVTNSAYGFASNPDEYSEARKGIASEFAVSRGTWRTTDASYWWLRSPGNNTVYAAGVYANGDVLYYGDDISRNDVAIRPAL